MNKLFSSGTRTVLIMFSVVSSIALFLDKIDPKDRMLLNTMVFTYFFTKKNDGSPMV